MLILLLSDEALRANYIGNGGFENDLNGWNASQGSGQATFSATSEAVKFDSKCLRVDVASAGSAPDFPRLNCNASIAAVANNTYTLSFFARCPDSSLDRRPAKLRIHLDGGTAAFDCDYQPFKGWQEFHYSFKTAGTVTFSITFEAAGVYELDRILLVDQNEPVINNQAVIDTPMSYLWQWGHQAYARDHHDVMTGTDNNIGQQLPDGRVAWVFNDSNLGPLDFSTNYRGGNSNLESSMVRNFVVMQTGDALAPLEPGKTVFVPADPHHLFWPTDATVDHGQLQVLLAETDPKTFVTTGGSLASFALPALTRNSPFLVPVPWSGEILDGLDGYLYIYDDPLGPSRKVARVPVGSLATGSAWTFYNGSTWVTDKSAATALGGLPTAANTGASFERLGPNNFAAISYGRRGNTIGVHFAPTPFGPWTNYISIYNMPVEDTQFYYDPHIYKHTARNGVYTVGFSDYSWGWDPGKPFDKDYYFPQFIKTPNLLAMSPYTSGTFRDDFSGGDLANWQIVGGHWNENSSVFSVTTPATGGAGALAKGIVLSDLVVDATAQSDTAGSLTGVEFRVDKQGIEPDVYSGYFAALKPGAGAILFRVDGGTTTELGSCVMTVTPGIAYHLKVVATSGALKVFVTDMNTPVITAADSTYSNGGVGLRASHGGGVFDDVSITDQRYECEHLEAVTRGSGTLANFYDIAASAGGSVTFAAKAVDDYVTFRLPQVSPGNYTVSVRVKKGGGSGIAAVAIGDTATDLRALGNLDAWEGDTRYDEAMVGAVTVRAQADQYVRLTVTGKNAGSSGYDLELDSIKLTPR